MSSKRRIRKKACSNKHHYTTYQLAALAALRARRSGNPGIWPYRCKFGNHSHIGHRPKSRVVCVRLAY